MWSRAWILEPLILAVRVWVVKTWMEECCNLCPHSHPTEVTTCKKSEQKLSDITCSHCSTFKLKYVSYSVKVNPHTVLFIAERLSVRLLSLQSVFSAGYGLNFHPTLSRFRNASKGVACVQTSVPFRNAIKVPVYKKCVHLCRFVIPSAMVSLSKNCDESEEERARRRMRKWKWRQRDKR